MRRSPPSVIQPLPPTVQQLALPMVIVAGTTALGPLALGPPIPPCQVWASLTPAAQQVLHGALVHILQEVRHDADHA